MRQTIARPIDLIADELRLQAWLARAEFENPSVREPATYERLSLLAMARDELRLQLHLGKLEYTDEWKALEARWGELKVLADHTAHDVEGRIEATVDALERGYDLIRKGH